MFEVFQCRDLLPSEYPYVSRLYCVGWLDWTFYAVLSHMGGGSCEGDFESCIGCAASVHYCDVLSAVVGEI